MTGQPSELIGVLGVLICTTIFMYNFLCKPVKPTPVDPDDWDMIPVGTSYAIAKNTKPKPKKKQSAPKQKKSNPKPIKKPTPKVKPASPKVKKTEGELYKDCVEALVGLGEKKSMARMKAGQVFAKHEPKTLDEFITKVFKK